MKLLRVGAPGQERLAVLTDAGLALDVSADVADLTPGVLAGDGLPRLAEAIRGGRRAYPAVDLDSVRVGPCIPRPHQILGIGLNYADHAEESGASLPAEPVVFAKSPNSLSGPYDPVLLPPGAAKVDWEAELGAVIGKRARYLDDEDAAQACIAGYCVVNDVSERAFQFERGGQWIKGKSAETFAPTGPWLVTPEEVGDPQDLRLFLDLNGERRQDSTTALMIFSVAHIVWHLSQFLVLEPGDLIATGTPHGVAFGQASPRWLREGDVMELGITGLGVQRQVCRRASRR